MIKPEGDKQNRN